MSRRTDLFNKVPVQAPPRSKFDLSFEKKLTGKFSYLYPFFLKECLPGDSWEDSSTVFGRYAPMLSPVMHRINIKTFWFKVPIRILWDNWEDFITGGQDGLYTASPPYMTVDAIDNVLGDTEMSTGSLWDHFGLPVMEDSVKTSVQPISVWPFLAYQKIWNDWFRDPNMDDELELPTELDGDISAQMAASGGRFISINRIGWEKDYFTSALPFTQRGAEVLIPMDAVGTVTYLPISNAVTSAGTPVPVTAGLQANNFGDLETDGGALDMRVENIDEVTVTNTTTAINDLRRAFAVQQWMEINARAGGRYRDLVWGQFKTKVSDFRLQMSEFLGAGSTPSVISEVLATANSVPGDPETEPFQPIGDMAGHGIVVGKNHGFSTYCEEHSLIIGILCAAPRSGYCSQGLERLWTRREKFDWPWPKLANIGEQELYKKELFFTGSIEDQTLENEAFGYLPRYTEWKYSIDQIAGDFRTTLGHWHLNRKFSGIQALDSIFTTMNENNVELEESMRRIFYVQDGTDYLWFNVVHRCSVLRCLPYFGVPSGLD